MKKNLLIIFLIVVILEIVVFNFNSYRVLSNNKKQEFSEDEIMYVNTEEEITYIKFEDLNTEVKTIHIELDTLSNVPYQVYYTDETSSYLRDIPSKMYVENYENSKYIPCYFSGKSQNIGIKIYSDLVNVKKVVINEKIPFNFNISRVIVLYGIVVFIYLLKTRDIFKLPYSRKIFSQELVLLFVLFVFMWISWQVTEYSTKLEEKYDFYSKDFVSALSKGQVYLEQKPKDILMNLDNPYDAGQRGAKGVLKDRDYIWDAAYYNGKYFVYFGILPAILMLPYHLITGKYISTATMILIFSMLSAISLKALIKNVFNRFLKEVPFKFMVFSFLILLFGSQILWLNGIPRFYELSIISGLFFAVTGINFVFYSTEENSKHKYWYWFVASLMLALSVACRPTQLLTSLIILPVIIKMLLKDFREKKSFIKDILAIGIPYLAVGIALMYYNYIRFGSILEFGASYQLTINDMSNLKNRFMTIGMGLICNLFSVPTFLPNFPFMIYHNNLLTFYGFYYVENIMGGLFIMVPICLFIFGFFKVWKRTENKDIRNFILTLICIGTLICVLSIMMGGSTQRYMVDYAWIFIIAGICTFNELVYLYKSEEAKNIMRKLLGAITIYVVLANLCSGIISEKHYMMENSPEEYYKLKYTIDFWE